MSSYPNTNITNNDNTTRASGGHSSYTHTTASLSQPTTTAAVPSSHTSSLSPQELQLQHQINQQSQHPSSSPPTTTTTTTTCGDTSEWPASPDQYNLLKIIGRGAFASVWRAHCRLRNEEQEDCAIKVLDLEQIDTNLVDIRFEVQAMRLSSHPNILTCHTSFVKDAELWLVTQLMRKGSSIHCIQSYQNLKDGEATAAELERHVGYILHQTLLGLKYIHENGQIHRDIKAGNILLDGGADVRIADFGVSGWLVNAGDRRENTKTFVGTPCWMAPEVMEQVHGYDYKADIWSLGITALELAKGYAPYAKYQPMKVLLMTIQEPPPSFETYDDEDNVTKWSKPFRDMVSLCLSKDPRQRPTCEELLNHKHFKGFNDESYLMERKALTKRELCDCIEDVGMESATNRGGGGNKQQYPGLTPLYILNDDTGPSRPSGTSWVFSNGSQVFNTSPNDNNDDDDDFYDEFERNTQGEHYSSSIAFAQAEAERVRQAEIEAAKEEERIRQLEKKEMEDFFDEFEKQTGGEHFRAVERDL